MIPKVIHYCWFGRGPMPEIAKECIDSWKKFLPDYEIRLWTEDNFDVNICTYTAEAYKAKKYAFVSDYARLWILYKYGGVYFDTDVKLLASPKAVLEKGPYMGTEMNGDESPISNASVAPGLGMAAEAGMEFIKTMLDRYDTYHFISPADGSLNLKTIVEYTTELLRAQGFPTKIKDAVECAGFTIYPKDYFSPRSIDGRKTIITPRTISIHLFTNTWNQKSFYGKMIARIKSFAIDYLIPSHITKAKLEKNRNMREKYFESNFMIR